MLLMIFLALVRLKTLAGDLVWKFLAQVRDTFIEAIVASGVGDGG